MTIDLYVASFGHRYSDPCTTFVGLTAEAVGDAVEEAMEYERGDLAGYCDIEHDDDQLVADCSLCTPDLVTFGVWQVYRTEELGGLRNTIGIIRDCRESKTGVTIPDCMMI
jgi:hypothetical protein